MKWVRYEESMNVPIKSWCHSIEVGALKQAFNMSKHPAVFHHIALMPDVHQGYGVPIGSVIACKDAIIPNAVGVDVSCVDKETEFLSPTGWVKISEYNGEQVMQFNPDDDTGEFVDPLRYIKVPCSEFIHIKTKTVDQMLSENHNCLIYLYDRSYKFEKYCNITASNIETEHNRLKVGFRHRFKTSFILKTDIEGINLTDDELRVMIMVSADGTLRKVGRCEVKFKKRRKIKRCEYLLHKANIPILNRHEYKDGSECISFNPPMMTKELSHFWKASLSQLRIITDEVFHWDGNLKNKCFYTRKKSNADFIQYALLATNKRATMREDAHCKDNKLDYRVFENENNKVGIYGDPKTPIKRVLSKDNFKYCFTVPSSYLVLRRNGKSFITGNCGMRFVKTTLRPESLLHHPKSLKKIINIIEKLVPVGRHHHKNPPENNLVLPSVFHHVLQREEKNLDKQLGTLGGGNHFIEIQSGDDGHVGFMIHCGSRNFGKKVCDYYNKEAKKLNKLWRSNLDESWDLAFLPIGTYEARAYIEEMKVAMAFAFENRRLISERVKEAFKETIDCDFYEDLDINHNYAAIENHFGENVWVHRKGATRARKGEFGIIPGSMGTSSYIVEGCGNTDSFNSCSHGAGRVMGRLEASRSLNEQECNKAMKGVLFRGWGTNRKGNVDLGEAPQAYKDIEDVMESQTDLVIPTVKLKPMAVVKAIEGER